jgi:catechol 2,3-dioxygenase-like lactoylglutathione lyase family enzyme
MAIELNHIIVPARDPQVSAQFLAGILDLPIDPPVARFTPITLANHVTLDYLQQDDFREHHCAFLVSEEEFDAAFARIKAAGIDYWADPHHQQRGQIYRTSTGGRGVYFPDPSGHNMEILTCPAG